MFYFVDIFVMGNKCKGRAKMKQRVLSFYIIISYGDYPVFFKVLVK